MKSKLGIAFLWIVAFLLGAVAGAVGYHIYREHLKSAPVRIGPPKVTDIVEGMARELKLDNRQKDSLRSIIENSREKYGALGRQYKPLWEAIRNQTDEQIKQMLRPDQRAKYEEFLKKVYSTPPGQSAKNQKSK